MARLITAGNELNHANASSAAGFPDGRYNAGTVAATVISSLKRSGGFAAQCASGAGSSVFMQYTITYAAATFFFRPYICFTHLPGSTIAILLMGPTALTSGASVRLTSGGKLQLWDNENNVQVGSDSALTIVADGATFYRIELSTTFDASTHVTALEGRVNGVSFASGTVTTTIAVVGVPTVGWVASPGATKTLTIDDVAINDSTGANQNSWPPDSKIVLLVPTATSAAGTNWRLGTGTAEGGVGWDSVNNEPPVGVADLAVGSDPKQIRNAGASANDDFDATMTIYTTGGVPSTGASINVIDPIVATAAPVATAAKLGEVGVVSNPVIANVALAAGGTSGAFWSGTTAGTYVTGWKWTHNPTYSQTVTLGTAPVMRIRQITSSTRIAMVCFMGMYVDYTPLVAPPERLALQAMNRAGNF